MCLYPRSGGGVIDSIILGKNTCTWCSIRNLWGYTPGRFAPGPVLCTGDILHKILDLYMKVNVYPHGARTNPSQGLSATVGSRPSFLNFNVDLKHIYRR